MPSKERSCLQRFDACEKRVCATGTAWGLLNRFPLGGQRESAIAVWWLARHSLYFGGFYLLAEHASNIVLVVSFSFAIIVGHTWKLLSFHYRHGLFGQTDAGQPTSKISPSESQLVTLEVVLTLADGRGSGLGLSASAGRVDVLSVRPGSAAALAALRSGDCITAVDGSACEGNLSRVQRSLKECTSKLTLTIGRRVPVGEPEQQVAPMAPQQEQGDGPPPWTV